MLQVSVELNDLREENIKPKTSDSLIQVYVTLKNLKERTFLEQGTQ